MCLNEAQERAYTETERAISAAIDTCESPRRCAGAVENLAKWISELPQMPESASHSLRQDVADELAGRFGIQSPVYVALLSARGAPRETALSALFRLDGWASNRKLRSKLLQLLRDDTASADDRVNVLWMFRLSEQFADVASDANNLARASDFDLARGASKVLTIYLVEDARSLDRVRSLALSRDSVLAEVAAESLLERHEVGPDSPLFPTLVNLVATLAESRVAPPYARADAIAALLSHDKDPAVIPVLLQLLSPDEWFFGAPGEHFRVHSLATLIVPLSDSDSPQIQQALRGLPALVHLIPEAEGRDYVEWELDHWIVKRKGSTPH